MQHRLRFLGVLLAATCAATTAQAANLVINGGFETGSFSGWALTGDTTLDAVICAPAFAQEGLCAATFGSVGASSGISQTLAGLSVGESYMISFALQPSGDMPSRVTTSFGGVTQLTIDDPQPTSGVFYTYYGFNVVAAGTTQTLQFGFRDDVGFIVLDDVTVTPIPEPATWALLGAGLAVLGIARRRSPAR